MIRPLALPPLCDALLLTVLWAPATFANAASAPVQTDHLQSRLVAQTTAAVPGTRLTLGLLLEHEPHWHTYWRNPGDSGLATKLELTLPEGVTAEAIAWPHPQRFELGGIVNFGYSERQLVPVTILIPADYSTSTLPVRAKASWLICEEQCIPGKAEYAFELPVAPTAEVDGRWREDFAAAQAELPRATAATLALAADEQSIVFTFSDFDAAATPAQWQWFPETPEVVANSAQPSWQRVPEGWRARWPKSEYYTALPAEVALVAVAVEGDGAAWRFARAATRAALLAPAATRSAGVGGGAQTVSLAMAGLLAALTALAFVLRLLMGRRTNRPKQASKSEETEP